MIGLPFILPLLILFLYQGNAATSDRTVAAVVFAGSTGVQVAMALWLYRRLKRQTERCMAGTADSVEPSVTASARLHLVTRLNRSVQKAIAFSLVLYFVQIHLGDLPALLTGLRYPDFSFGVRIPALALPFFGDAISIHVWLEPTGATFWWHLRDLAADLLLLVPPYAMIFALRLASFRPLQRIRQLDCDRGTYLRFQVRTAFVFALPLWLYLESFRHAFVLSDTLAVYFERHAALALLWAATVIAVIFLLAPLLVRRLFPAANPESVLGPLRWQRLVGQLQTLAGRLGAQLSRIVVWHTEGLRVANAAVAGLLRRQQRVFVSDVLLQQLSDDEIVAVVAHELGHQRLYHPALNLLVALSTIAFVSLGVFLFSVAGSKVIPHFEFDSAWLAAIVVALNLLYLVTVFRFFLNRFEYQADAFAADALGSERPLMAALHHLVQLNMLDPGRGGLTHPSPVRRLMALERLADPEARRAWLDSQRRRNRLFALLALLILMMTAGLLEGLST